jgi:hypothetical protein
MHDPALVEVYIYALNPDDGEKYYKKIAKSVEHFVPMGHENNINVIAERINADGSADSLACASPACGCAQ